MEIEQLPAEFQEFKDCKVQFEKNVQLLELDGHLKNFAKIDSKFQKLEYLEGLSLKNVFDNFYEVIEDEADCSSFSAENRQRIKSLKLLSMYNELERYNSQEFESQPEFKQVSYDEVARRIQELQVQNIKDCQFVNDMKFKLQDIKAQEKYDNLYSMIKKVFPKNIQEAETAPGSDEEKLLD